MGRLALSRPTDPVLASWSRDEVLDFAVRRGTQLRRRRLTLQSVAAAVAVVSLALPLALIAGDAESASKLHTVNRPTVTDTDDAGPADATGPSDPAPAGGGAPPSPVATTARGAKPDPLGTKATTTTAPAAAPAQLGPCDRSEVELATTTDKAAYLAREPVVVTARARNIGTRPCARPVQTDMDISHEVGGRMYSASEPGADERWEPSQEIVFTFTWDQSCPPSAPCTAGLATQGRYTATAGWAWGRGTWTQSASFTIGAG